MYRRKLEDVQKEAGGCTEGSLRLSDQMLIAASIAKIDNHHSLSRSVTHSLARVGIELLLSSNIPLFTSNHVITGLSLKLMYCR